MNVILKAHLLSGVLTEGNILKLNEGAAKLLKQHRITFKILNVSKKAIVIQAAQSKTQNVKSDPELEAIAEKLFTRFIKDKEISVIPVTYEIHPVASVTPEWIKNKMNESGKKARDIVQETDLPKASISNWLSGNKPMSNIVKALFYYYFKDQNNQSA